jgi:hypothetical protein
MRALPAYARSCRLIQAWTDEGAGVCTLAQQAFWDHLSSNTRLRRQRSRDSDLRRRRPRIRARHRWNPSTFTNEYGTFQVRESLFAGTGRFLKFESTWQAFEIGSSRFITAIPFGNLLQCGSRPQRVTISRSRKYPGTVA